jgi:glycosyltransferase involved in cell wall biosynthesis
MATEDRGSGNEEQLVGDDVVAWARNQESLIALEAKYEKLTAESKARIKTAEASAKKAERALRSIRRSPWWRATSPARRAVGRAKRKSRNSRDRNGAQAIAPNKTDTSDTADLFVTDQQKELLRERLLVVSAAIGIAHDPDVQLSKLLAGLVAHLDRADNSDPTTWLLYIAFASRMPTRDHLAEAIGELEVDGAAALIEHLTHLHSTQQQGWNATASIRLVSRTFVDVTNTARAEYHSGIQRVVREIVPRWAAQHDLVLAVFDYREQAYRPPNIAETDNVLRWGSQRSTDLEDHAGSERVLLIPWQTQLVLPDLAGEGRRSDPLSALAASSGTHVNIIFYDMIPLAMPEICIAGMPDYFSNYFSVVRKATRASAISRSSADDLRGFCRAFVNQGIVPPSVVAHPLPIHAAETSEAVMSSHRDEVVAIPGVPLVLSVSSIEPRKNHVRTLQAAEILWREGYSFQLMFIAASGWRRDLFDRQYQTALDRGRPVRVVESASEGFLWSAYRLARFSVFISITEGYGLPAAESIASGTPVLLSDHGSMREIGEGGGAEFVDVYSLTDITAGMRRLLTDDDHLDALQSAASSRDLPTWDSYSTEVWDWLVDGVDVGKENS